MTYDLLQGVRVLELGGFISAPYCAKLLADLGAQVIKVEPVAGGDVARSYGPFPNDEPSLEASGLFLCLNTNKMGITLDFRTATGRKLLSELLSISDVVVENLPLPEAEVLGLTTGEALKTNKSLILAAITPFGLTGPYRNYKAYEINLTAASGVSVGIGLPDREPLDFPVPLAGYQAGVCAATATLSAVLARSISGRGQLVDVSEAECLASVFTGPEILMWMYQWRITRRTGHHARDFPYPNCSLRCKDGYVYMGAPEARQWRKLLELMGQPSWAKDPRFSDRTAINTYYADEVDALMEEWMAAFTTEELFQLGLANRLPLAPVKTPAEVLADTRFAGFFEEIETPAAGRLKYPVAPYQVYGAHPPKPARPPPALGQDNQAIYCGLLGRSNDDLVKLFQTGVI